MGAAESKVGADGCYEHSQGKPRKKSMEFRAPLQLYTQVSSSQSADDCLAGRSEPGTHRAANTIHTKLLQSACSTVSGLGCTSCIHLAASCLRHTEGHEHAADLRSI